MENKPTAIVRVHRPDLTPEERAERMERVRKAAARVMLAVWANEDKKKGGATNERLY